jgi:hypothetical protein
MLYTSLVRLLFPIYSSYFPYHSLPDPSGSLLHLNKFIVRDFPRKTTIEQELIKYIVDIYFTIEIEFLSELGKKENDNTG